MATVVLCGALQGCGSSNDDDDVAGEVVECKTPSEAAPSGLVAVQIEPFTDPVPTGIEGMTTRAIVTNASDRPIELQGEGDDVLYGFLTGSDGSVVSAVPPGSNMAIENPTLQPGESIDWPLYLWLERCGVERGHEIEPGTYQVHAQLRVSTPDGAERHDFLSTELIEIEVPNV